MWQAIHEELGPLGLAVITVAIDRSPDDARPYIDRAHATHPSLIDTEHRVADLYNMVNVPTVLWIDEEGRIVRPQDVHYVSTEFASVTKFHPRKPLAALRSWVRGESEAYPGDPIADLKLASDTDQRARAAFAIGWHLAQQGNNDAAERWFQRAGELAPHDFNIRRGSMPIRGIDPAGPAFFEMVGDWVSKGNAYYLPLSDTASDAHDFEVEPVEQLSPDEVRRRILENG